MTLFTEWEGPLPDPDDPDFETNMVALFTFFIGIPVEANAMSAAEWFQAQSSISDPTAGRVMINGAHGLGGQVATTANDADTATYGGMFMASDLSTATNWPSWFGSGPGSLMVIAGQNANNFTQFSVAQNAGIDPAYRNYRSGGFGSWERFPVQGYDVTFDDVTATGSVKFPSYTVGTVPSASGKGAGAEIYITNETGGAVPAFSDGTNWRRYSDRAIIS